MRRRVGMGAGVAMLVEEPMLAEVRRMRVVVIRVGVGGMPVRRRPMLRRLIIERRGGALVPHTFWV
jgi:hypothetical protein